MSNSVPASCSDCSEKLGTTSHEDFSPADQDISNDEQCLEMDCQALLHSDQRAKEKLQRRFSKDMLGWLRIHPRREEAYHCGDEEYYVVQAFEYFWQAIVQRQEVELSTLTAVLKYLQASLDGVIIETLSSLEQKWFLNVSMVLSSRH